MALSQSACAIAFHADILLSIHGEERLHDKPKESLHGRLHIHSTLFILEIIILYNQYNYALVLQVLFM